MSLSLTQAIYGLPASQTASSNPWDYRRTVNVNSSSSSLRNCYQKSDVTPVGDELQTGTTIVAVRFKDGVILGADSRSSVSSTYVANRLTDKLQPLTDNIFILRSGSSAHTQNVGDYVAYYLNSQRQEVNEPPRVATAAKLIQSIIYSNKSWMSASIIIAGWDKYEGGQIYACPAGATLAKKVPFAIGGSGSSYIYGYIDHHFRSTELPDEQARLAVRKAISHAIFRDGSSGGVTRTVSITSNGLHRETHEPFDISEMSAQRAMRDGDEDEEQANQ